MTCCLNPDCPHPLNPDGRKFCQYCNTPLVQLLRGHYRVMRLLSDEGGFGRTYLAEDVDKLHQSCVLKQLAPKTQEPWAIQKAIQLFEQEARRLEELGEHPQIPTLLAYFEQDYYLYLVQQFIDGQNLLAELQTQGAFRDSQIQDLLFDLLPVLKFVHEHDVIHRDISPQNLIRRQSDQRLVLIDFGASKQLTTTVYTKVGTTIGKYGYSPIEQIQGGEAYPASDLFSLGATCFHLLTQISPFHLWTDQGYNWVTDWQEHLRSPVSNELRQVLTKLLKKDLQDRYQSVDEVLTDLTPPPQPPPQSNVPPTIPVEPLKTEPPVRSRVSNKLKKRLLLGSVALLSGLAATQIYGYVRYGFFPSSPLFLAISLPSSFFLERTLTGHSDLVYSVAFSPDGQILASAGGEDDKTVKLWNPKTGQEIQTLKGHSSRVNSVAFSPDGQILASGGDDDTIRVWNLKTGEENRILKVFSSPVSIAISPDGQVLASNSNSSYDTTDKTITLWNLNTGQVIRTFPRQREGGLDIVFSPDSKLLASGGFNGNIKLWNPATGQGVHTLQGYSDQVNAIVISPDGQTLAGGGGYPINPRDTTIKLWNLKTGQVIRTLQGHSRLIVALAISRDGKTLASGSGDTTIKLWNLETGQEIYTLKGHLDLINSISFSPDGKTLASAGDKTIKIWRVPK